MPEPTVDAYLEAQPAAARAVLARVRGAIVKALPEATESISYRIPTYKIGGRMVLYVAAFREHWSIYPATDRLLAELGDELEGRLHGRGTLRFTYDEPFPAKLVARIAKLRALEVAEREAARKLPKKRASRR